MVRPVVTVVICFGLFLVIQNLIPKVIAIKKSDVDQFMLEDQRVHKKKNYMTERNKEKDFLASLENVGITYENEPYDLDKNPEELSAFIVDYANMIRNDVILLDKSVETRTRKRGNFKVGTYNNQAISDPPCQCEYSEKSERLGDNFFPKSIKTRNCSRGQQTCSFPYACKETYYYLPVLKRKDILEDYVSQEESPDVPEELQSRWISEKRAISIGCICTRDYITKDN